MTPIDPQQSNHALSVPAELPRKVAPPALYSAMALGGEGSASPPGLTAAPTLAGLTQALRRRWLLALGLALLATTATVTAVFVCLPPRYVVEARFIVNAAPDAGLLVPTPDQHVEFALFKEYQKALIHAPMVITAALNEKVSNGREARDLPLVRAEGNGIVDWLEHALKADFRIAPEIMSAFLTGDDPDGLADLLNAMAVALVKENDEKEKMRRKERLDLYRENLKLKEQDLSGLRAKLAAKYLPEEMKDKRTKEQLLAQAQQDLSQYKVLLQNLQLSASANELDLADWQARLKNINTQPVPLDQVDDFLRIDGKSKMLLEQMELIDLNVIAIERTAASPEKAKELIAPLLRERAGAQQKLDKRRTDCMPEVEGRYRSRLKVDLTEKVDSAERKRGSLSTQIKGFRDQAETLGKLIARLDPMLQNDPPDLAHLKDEIKSTEAAVDRIRQTILTLSVEGTNSRVSIQMRASPPTDKDYSRQVKLAGAGGVSAFALMLFGVGLWEFRSRRIGRTDEVSHGLGLHIVGALPAVRPGKDPTAARELAVQAQLQEAVDGVRTMLLHAARNEPMRVVMVTSACGGEGKTSVATQLAASLARAWRKTLLIDGDLRNPAAHQLFELPREPGLSEVLRGEVTLEDAIRPAPVSRLWVLPAGQWDGQAIQALAQDEVHAIFAKLKEQYDYIIVDSSPVLPVADTLLLAQHADGVLFSILRDVSRAPEVHAAQQRLAPLGVRTLGAVVIGMASDLSQRAYQYGAR